MPRTYLTVVLIVLSSPGLFGQTGTQTTTQPAAPTAALTPAELGIQRAEAKVKQHPDQSAGYNTLAMAYARRARETSDVSYYTRAEETLQKSLELTPDNFEALKIRTWLLLGRHQFAAARVMAEKLNKKMPDDVIVYGYLADANAELGNYGAAENAAQWMLNLRPGNIAGLTRGAYLRELYGNLPGAIDFMKMAYDSTSFRETEDRAWILTQIAHIYLISGDQTEAEAYATGALKLFPNYHYALGVLGQVRMTQHRYGEAVDLFRARYNKAPHAENIYALAEALQLNGQKEEALDAYAKFEQKALRESTIADNANHELIAYYIDHAGKGAEALRLATSELERRHDVYTLDCYAWALASTGDYKQANRVMEQALSVGVKDPKLQSHARSITARLSETASTGAR
jgi:tetratricopeptide (TPR) repeat protein